MGVSGDAVALAPHTAAPPVGLRSLTLRDFRNIARADLDVPTNGVVLVGRNGHGKTNLLEAVHYAHALRSIRGARDTDLIRFGAEAFHVGFEVSGARWDSVKIGFERTLRRKRVLLDGVEPPRLGDALGSIPSVVFTPRDVSLVSGAPQERRRFLDILLSSCAPGYLNALLEYRGALARRNAVLRTNEGRPGTDALVRIWEPAMAAAGARIWFDRYSWAKEVSARVRALCRAIGESGRVTVRYHAMGHDRLPSAESAAALEGVLRERLEQDRPQDIRRGMTGHGPHRDDLTLTLDDRLVRTFGSAGQQRTVAMTLRIVEAETLATRLGRSPLILLDDPFAELDPGRSRAVMELLGALGPGQRWLAVPRPDDVPESFMDLARWNIVEGSVAS